MEKDDSFPISVKDLVKDSGLAESILKVLVTALASRGLWCAL